MGMEPQESLHGSAGGEEALGQGQGHICVAPLREGRLAGVAGMQGARGGCEKLSGSLRLRLPRARGFCRALLVSMRGAGLILRGKGS